MLVRSSWLAPVRDGDEGSADVAPPSPSGSERRAVDLLDALLLVLLVAPFFLF